MTGLQLRDTRDLAWLVHILEDCARGGRASADAHLWSVGQPLPLPGSKTTFRAHYLKTNANGVVRVKPLVNMLATRIIDYCIPRTRIREALAADAGDGSTAAIGRLAQEAADLFADVAKSGEGGELLLYYLLETVLRIPQILCKMPLKTNANVHYHGVDGVHATVASGDTLAVYWGESKLYANPSNAIRACLESIVPFLLDDGAGSTDRDQLLVRDNVDLNNPDVEQALKLFFDQSKEESTRLEYRGACLIGFSKDNYPPNPHDQKGAVVAAVETEIGQWTADLRKHLTDHKVDRIEIEFFCVPFPSVDEFRREMLERLGGSI